jgi:hypothetical protein
MTVRIRAVCGALAVVTLSGVAGAQAAPARPHAAARYVVSYHGRQYSMTAFKQEVVAPQNARGHYLSVYVDRTLLANHRELAFSSLAQESAWLVAHGHSWATRLVQRPSNRGVVRRGTDSVRSPNVSCPGVFKNTTSLWHGANCSGTSAGMAAAGDSISCLKDYGLNDHVYSMDIATNTAGLILWANCGFGGNNITFAGGDVYPHTPTPWNNTASSARTD